MNYRTALQALSTVIRTGPTILRLSTSACRDGANQNWVELSGLAHLVRQVRPLRVMEIGMDLGGTMALWAQLAGQDAILVGVDIRISNGVEQRIKSKLKDGQTLSLVEGDSHSGETKKRILNILGGNKLDFLFIDGDHDYEGVKQDFQDYAVLVRSGGLVAFHDIVPDSLARFGVQTKSYSGGVYKVWREVSSQYPHYEFIENIAQDGYGIGVVRV